VQLSQIPTSLRAFYRRPRALLAGNKYMAVLLRAHRKDPQWYLMVLCADPPVQRKRRRKRCCWKRPSRRVDAEGVGSHLETPRYDNVAYYQRFGYELMETLTPVEGAPTVLHDVASASLADRTFHLSSINATTRRRTPSATCASPVR